MCGAVDERVRVLPGLVGVISDVIVPLAGLLGSAVPFFTCAA